MKVMHLLSTDRFAGAENVVCQIIRLFSADTDVSMTYCSPEGVIANVLSGQKINYIPLKTMSFAEIKRVVKEYRPDVIHAHDMRASFLAACAAGKTPLISQIHNNAYKSRKPGIKSIAYIYAVLKAKSIIWVSESAFEGYAFNSLAKRKSMVLRNIVNPEELTQRMLKDRKDYDYDVAYIGRLSYPKNPMKMLTVIKQVKERYTDLKAVIVGWGEEEEDIKNHIKEWNLEKNIDFFGFRENPLKILHDSKLMLMTSRWEGTPMVVLEAMALGVPIVSTSVDGLRELVTDGVNGFLSDDENEITDRICRLLADPELRKWMSSEQILKFNKVNNISEYKECLKRVYYESKL